MEHEFLTSWVIIFHLSLIYFPSKEELLDGNLWIFIFLFSILATLSMCDVGILKCRKGAVSTLHLRKWFFCRVKENSLNFFHFPCRKVLHQKGKNGKCKKPKAFPCYPNFCALHWDNLKNIFLKISKTLISCKLVSRP